MFLSLKGRTSDIHGRLNAKNFGAVPIEKRPNFDSTQYLNAALEDSIKRGVELYIPAGTYRITSTLIATGYNVMISGAGGNMTKIKPDSHTYDALSIGIGSTGSGQYPSGYLSGISIEGYSSWTTGFTAGIKIDGMRQFEVRDVNVQRMPIGFDLVNNCYGTKFVNCRSNLSGLPLNLRTGPVSGSDITFYNCWFRGKNGSVWVSPDSGGFHFYGGQLTGGDSQGADNDDVGIVVLGKDYIDGTIGSVGNVNFDGIDFEGSKYIWQVRSFGQSNLTISNSSFLSTGLASAAEKPLGIIKGTTFNQSKTILINNSVAGVWKAAKAIDIAGQGSLGNINEFGTSMVNGTVTFNSVANTASLLEQSRSDIGGGFFRSSFTSKLLVGNTMIRSVQSTGKFDISYDWGTTWIPLQQVLSGTTAARPASNTYTGQFYFDTTLNKPIWRNTANNGWVDAAGTTV